MKPFELKLKVCTTITNYLFDLKYTVAVYRGRTTIFGLLYWFIPNILNAILKIVFIQVDIL